MATFRIIGHLIYDFITEVEADSEQEAAQKLNETRPSVLYRKTSGEFTKLAIDEMETIS